MAASSVIYESLKEREEMFKKLRVQAMVHESPLKRKIKEMKKRSRDFAQKTQTKRRQVYVHTGRLGVSAPARITGITSGIGSLTSKGLGGNLGIGARSSLAFAPSFNPDSDAMPTDHKPTARTKRSRKTQGSGAIIHTMGRNVGPQQNEAGYQFDVAGPAKWTTSGWVDPTGGQRTNRWLAANQEQLKKILGGGLEAVDPASFGVLGQEAQRRSQIQENERKAQTRTSRLQKRKRSRAATFSHFSLIK